MGVIYKLKDEVKGFILDEKKANPHLSCRGLEQHVEAKFNIKLSKSSINALIKEAGLSAPIGRRAKKKKPHIAMPVLPILLENNPEPEVKRLEQGELRGEIEDKSREEAERKVQEEERRRKEEAEALMIEKERWTRLASEEAEQKAAIEKKPEQGELRGEIEDKSRLEEEKLAKEAIERENARRIEEERIKLEELNKAQEETERKAKEEAEALMIEKERWTRLASEEAGQKAAMEKFIEPLPEILNSGLVLLESADYLIGAGKRIAELIQNKINGQDKDTLIKTKNLLYSSMLFLNRQKEALDSLAPYINDLKSVKILGLDILNIINNSLQDVRCAKVLFADGNAIYLDGQFYSVWSTPHIPYDFSAPVYNIKNCLSSYFYENKPIIIFNSSGYDIPSQELFRLLLALDDISGKISKITLYGNKLEELKDAMLLSHQKHQFIFGLWPWQFTEYRNVDKIGEFRPMRLESLRKDFYIADIEITLSCPNIQEKISLRGAALKTNLNEKTRLVILTNLLPKTIAAQELALSYLSHWPNIEEAFQDFSRKIELFTYTASSQRFFSADSLALDKESAERLEGPFKYYLKALDLYVRWHFLPSGYEDQDFATINERFYGLKTQVDKEETYILVTFQPPLGYAFLKDLEYACRRMNEREIKSCDGKKLWFAV